MQLTKKEVFLVMTDNEYALEGCPTGVDSVWTDEKKAEKRKDELVKAAKDVIWYVCRFYISK